jgi:hypothetical protein
MGAIEQGDEYLATEYIRHEGEHLYAAVWALR